MHLSVKLLKRWGSGRSRPRGERGRFSGEQGITVLLALYVLTITTLLLGAAYVAVLNDTGLSRNDLDQTRALAAAQAGIAQYSFNLNNNPNYWEGCPVANSVAVATPAAGSTEFYSYKPLAATGQTSCDSSNAVGTMIESSGPAAGTFRISSTGTSNNVSRTVVVQYRRASFLDFVYYTDFEAFDPATEGYPTDCAFHWPNRNADCGLPISFVPGDVINGPMHTEDTAAICGDGTNSHGPVFGRTSADQIQVGGLSNETSGGVNGTQYNSGNCQLSYKMVGTLVEPGPTLLPPPSNAQLLNVAQSGGYVYTGNTTIALTGTTMTVTNSTSGNTGPTGVGLAMPSNGVIYVTSASAPPCAEAYTPGTANALYPPVASNIASCGNVFVSGNYGSSLTIASDNDVIIDGNIIPTGTPLTTPATVPSGTALVGLVANNFVRVEHGCASGSNVANQTFTSPYIYAAILAVQHSFIVDNYNCGAQLGTLNVYGTIAQLFRGVVGTSGGQGTGYFKGYSYDNRLQYAEPPYFLNPVSVAWKVQRQTECNGSGC